MKLEMQIGTLSLITNWNNWNEVEIYLALGTDLKAFKESLY